MQGDDSVKVITVGLIGNVILCGLKISAGISGRSYAVLADGIHSVSDIVTDVGLLIGVFYWRKPADAEHPYGHGRLENLIALGLSVVLAIAAVVMVRSSLTSLNIGTQKVPGWIAAAAALLSLFVKEGLFRWTLARGKRLNSAAIKANAWHHRSDAFSSVPALIAVVVAITVPGWWFVDAIGAVVVAVIILYAAWTIGFEAFQALMDRGAPRQEVLQIKKSANEVEGVKAVHAVRTRSIGRGWGVDLHVLVPEDMTVKKGHDIAEQVREHLMREHKNVSDVVVHIEPQDHADH